MRLALFEALVLAGLLIAAFFYHSPLVGAQPKPTSIPTTVIHPTSIPGYETTVPTVLPGTLPPTVAPTPAPTPKPSTPPPPTASPPPPGSLVWQAGLSAWHVRSGSGQCGTPTVSGGIFSFGLAQNAGACYRNQLHPAPSGQTAYLQEGATYRWTFVYRDSDANFNQPGMNDCKVGFGNCGVSSTGCPGASCAGDARSLIWQLHPNSCACTPCVTLNFVNGPTGTTFPQTWGWYDCGPSGTTPRLQWTGTYAPGARVTWQIDVKISAPQGTANGSVVLRKEGVTVYSASNVVTMCCATYTAPSSVWWNYGPYKWIWSSVPNRSSQSSLNATFENMVLTKLAAAKHGHGHDLHL
jgi:hypothetical protein